MLWHENVHGELLPFSSTSICPPSTLPPMLPAKLKFLYVNYCQAARQPQECVLNLASFVQPDYSLCHKTVRWTIENQLTESVAVALQLVSCKKSESQLQWTDIFRALGDSSGYTLKLLSKGCAGQGLATIDSQQAS